MERVIELSDIVVDYPGKRALDGLSLSVGRGEVFGFLGPNGAGKSTAIKVLLGLVRPDRGGARLHGRPASDPASRRSVGYLPEETHYYRFLTPEELLDLYGRLLGLDASRRRRRSAELIELIGLGPFRRKQLGTLSKGTVQKVSLAQALLGDPETLVLDEPASGLDPIARTHLRELLRRLNKEGGKTLFFSSHELSEVELLCDTCAILSGGRLLRQGPMRELVGEAGGGSLERFFVSTVTGKGVR